MSEAHCTSAAARCASSMPSTTDRLLLVASDRISTFDVVLPTEIPDKGRVLTGLSGFWFARTSELVPNHLLALRDDGRSTECRRLEMLPIECVVRGYLAGSGWKDYLATGAVCGHTLPAGLSESQQLPQPIFTPATKAQSGHDENIDRAAAVELVGGERFDEVERIALALYAFVSALRARARDHPRRYEARVRRSTRTGRLVLGDEAFTPDSSRFWPADDYEPGRRRPRSTSSSSATTASRSAGTRPLLARSCPDDVVAGTRARYIEAFERLTGDPLRRLPRRPGRGARMRATVLVRPKPGILDPQGQAVESSLRHLGFDVGEARVGRLVDVELATDDREQALAAARADVRAPAGQPADRELLDRARRAHERDA